MHYTHSLALFTLASTAAAHGIVSYISDNEGGVVGPDPNTGSNNGIWTAGINPVTDAFSPDMFCGPSAHANGVSYVSAGETIDIYWEETSYQQWPHNTGPILTYMAKCYGDCSGMNKDNTNWFKIDQQAFENGQWKQAQLMNGGGYAVTLPWDLQAGDYLMRTEVIALHNSYPEYYPRCIHWSVTGGAANTYSQEASATFPGTYYPSQPGLASSGGSIYNVQSTAAYQFPGPDVVAVGQGAQPAQPQNNVNAQQVQNDDSNDSGNDNGNNNNNDGNNNDGNQWSAQEVETDNGNDDNNNGYENNNGNNDNNDNNDDNDGNDDEDYCEEVDEEDEQAGDAGNNDGNTDTANTDAAPSSAPAPESSSAPAPQPTSSASVSASSAPAAPEDTDTCTSHANEDDCERKWTQCNNDYVPGTEYTCQDKFASCRGQSVQRRLANNAMSMRKRVAKRHDHIRYHKQH